MVGVYRRGLAAQLPAFLPAKSMHINGLSGDWPRSRIGVPLTRFNLPTLRHRHCSLHGMRHITSLVKYVPPAVRALQQNPEGTRALVLLVGLVVLPPLLSLLLLLILRVLSVLAHGL